jgi:AraC-like DNA-binding protein
MEKIVHLIESRIIPWTLHNGAERLIVAQPMLRASMLPRGVTLSPIPIKGKRVVRRNSRLHGNQRLFLEDWPEANLQTLTVPKLACIVDGGADYLLGKYSVYSAAGNFIVIPPRAPHQKSGPFLSTERASMGKYGLVQAYAFSNGVRVWCSSCQSSRHVSNYADHYFIYDQNAADLLRILTAVAEEAKPNWGVACGSLLTAFFSFVAQDIKDGLFTRQSRNLIEAAPALQDADFANQVRIYIDNYCHKPIKLPDAAAHFYMSISQFTRHMRHECDKTFVEMLTQARVELARQYLCETNLTFTMIAGYCCFHSVSHFRSLFSKQTGCSPSEYRRQNAVKPLPNGVIKK